jgi:hypothetical protein
MGRRSRKRKSNSALKTTLVVKIAKQAEIVAEQVDDETVEVVEPPDNLSEVVLRFPRSYDRSRVTPLTPPPTEEYIEIRIPPLPGDEESNAKAQSEFLKLMNDARRDFEHEFWEELHRDQAVLKEEYRAKMRTEVDEAKANFEKQAQVLRTKHHESLKEKSKHYKDQMVEAARSERFKFMVDLAENTHFYLTELHRDLHGSLQTS